MFTIKSHTQNKLRLKLNLEFAQGKCDVNHIDIRLLQ